MKRIFCPKCDYQIAFDPTVYPVTETRAFVCPGCGTQFDFLLDSPAMDSPIGSAANISQKESKVGCIQIIENAFGFAQTLALQPGRNVIGRRNKDTSGVDLPIITSDPSMGRSHCVVEVSPAPHTGRWIYTLYDFPSVTGTFYQNTLLKKKERIRLTHGAVVTIGATTFILHTANPDEGHE